mgnify:CR=1 FL=1
MRRRGRGRSVLGVGAVAQELQRSIESRQKTLSFSDANESATAFRLAQLLALAFSKMLAVTVYTVHAIFDAKTSYTNGATFVSSAAFKQEIRLLWQRVDAAQQWVVDKRGPIFVIEHVAKKKRIFFLFFFLCRRLRGVLTTSVKAVP